MSKIIQGESARGAGELDDFRQKAVVLENICHRYRL